MRLHEVYGQQRMSAGEWHELLGDPIPGLEVAMLVARLAPHSPSGFVQVLTPESGHPLFQSRMVWLDVIDPLVDTFTTPTDSTMFIYGVRVKP